MKQNIQRIGIAIFCLSMLGCGTTIHYIDAKHEIKNSSSLFVGQTLEKKIGEVMVANEDLHFYDGLIATSDYNPKPQLFMGTITYPTIKKGYMFKKVGKFDNGDIMYVSINELHAYGGGWGDLKYQPLRIYSIITNSLGEPYGDASSDGYFVRTWDDKPNFLATQRVYEKESFREELTYMGKTKDTIKLSYREYMDNLARPAFTQDLMYDLAESKTISFKSMNIDIIEATNSSIKFIVKSPLE